MAMQSLHRFASLKSLLDFREAYTKAMDCYIYCKDFPKGLVVDGYTKSGAEVFLFAARYMPIDGTFIQGGSAAYLLVYSGFSQSLPEDGDAVSSTSPFISLSVAQSSCIETVLGEVLLSREEKKGQFLSFLELLLAPSDLNVVPDIGPYGRRLGIAYRFIVLVQREATRHHDVHYYADILCIGASYLTRCVHVTLNMSAKQFIVAILMEQAEKLLFTTDDTVMQISEQLGFQNSASFTAFFKHNKGVPPNSFRR